jgi:hypothetical protein
MLAGLDTATLVSMRDQLTREINRRPCVECGFKHGPKTACDVAEEIRAARRQHASKKRRNGKSPSSVSSPKE